MRPAIRRLANDVKVAIDTARTFGSDPERKAARERVWATLDDDVKVFNQWLGRLSAGCMATYNVYERCDFSCTACYLAKEANQTPPLPFEEVKAQLDAMRAHAGPGSNVQITAGEVTLLPVEDLIRIVRYAKEEARLDPMVMTHGQTFIQDPTYLERLVVEGGLEKVAIHIDTTQRGRIGQTKRMKEKDLHLIRDQFANLIRTTRKRTGVHLHAAHTFTITEDNLPEVPEVMRWMVKNSDAFRMISFQPTADVGRTRVKEQVGKRDLIWSKIAEGLGLERVNRNTFLMGHPACNNVALLWVVEFDGETHLMEVTREGEPIDRWFFEELMSGAFQGFYVDGASTPELVGRFLGLFFRSPKYLWQWPAYSTYRAFCAREWTPRFFKAIATGKPWNVRPLIVVCHNFMSSHELATKEGQKRLQHCAFRLPVDGKMVPMCEMNGTDLRRRKNLEAQERLLGIERKGQAA